MTTIYQIPINQDEWEAFWSLSDDIRMIIWNRWCQGDDDGELEPWGELLDEANSIVDNLM